MDLTNVFMNLPEKGIELADLRQLIYLNVPQENVQSVIKSLDYWCCKWKGTRFPTPLRIVYCLKNLKMIALPFLDLSIDQDKFWGIELNHLVIHKNVLPSGPLMPSGSNEAALCEIDQRLQACSSQTYQGNLTRSQMVQDTCYDIRLPTAKEMRLMMKNYRDIDGTFGVLRRYGIAFDKLSCSAYWTQELDEVYQMGISVIESDHVLVRQPFSDMTACLVRPVLSIFDQDKGLDFVGHLDKYGLPDEESERFAEELREA